MPEYFISYARSEISFVDSLYQDLKLQRFDVWMDIHQLRAGQAWQTQIFDAIDAAHSFILIVSKGSIESPNVCDEIARAQEQGKRIYLIIFEACPFQNNDQIATSAQPDWEALKHSAFVDFREEYSHAFHKFVRLLKENSLPSGDANDVRSSEKGDRRTFRENTPVPEYGFRMIPVATAYVRRVKLKLILLVIAAVLCLSFFILRFFVPDTFQSRGSFEASLDILAFVSFAFLFPLGYWMLYVRKAIRERKYHYWYLILGELIASVLSIIFVSFALLFPVVSFLNGITNHGENRPSAIVILLGLSLFLPPLINIGFHSFGTISSIFALASADMYRWAGSYGIPNPEYRGWFHSLRFPILAGILLLSCPIVVVALIVFNDAEGWFHTVFGGDSSRVEFLNNASVTFVGILGFIVLFLAFAGTVATRSMLIVRKYRQRLVDARRIPQPLKFVLLAASEDRMLMTSIQHELQKFHQAVDPEKADIGIALLSKSYSKVPIQESIPLIPIMISGEYAKLDKEVLALQIVDWRSGISNGQLNLLARYLDQPAQLVTVLSGFPRRIQIDSRGIQTSSIQNYIGFLYGLAVFIFLLTLLPALQSTVGGYFYATSENSLSSISALRPFDRIMSYLGMLIAGRIEIGYLPPETWVYCASALIIPFIAAAPLLLAAQMLKKQQNKLGQQFGIAITGLILGLIILNIVFNLRAVIVIGFELFILSSFTWTYTIGIALLLACFFWLKSRPVIALWFKEYAK